MSGTAVREGGRVECEEALAGTTDTTSEYEAAAATLLLGCMEGEEASTNTYR